MTPEYLANKIAEINAIRTNLLCDGDELGGSSFDPFAEQHFLSALNALDEANRQLRLAQLHQTRAIASKQKG